MCSSQQPTNGVDSLVERDHQRWMRDPVYARMYNEARARIVAGEPVQVQCGLPVGEGFCQNVPQHEGDCHD